MTANVKKCAVVVCSGDMVSPVSFSSKWGEDELLIVDQYTYLGVQISNGLLLGYTHGKNNRKKGKTHVGKMDAILSGSHLGH